MRAGGMAREGSRRLRLSAAGESERRGGERERGEDAGFCFFGVLLRFQGPFVCWVKKLGSGCGLPEKKSRVGSF